MSASCLFGDLRQTSKKSPHVRGIRADKSPVLPFLGARFLGMVVAIAN
jgi:hypothetical protein